jgi:hypothetical protein
VDFGSRWTKLCGIAVCVCGLFGAPFSKRAFNRRLRPSCRALGVGQITARRLPQRGHYPSQPRVKGSAGNSGVAPPQEYLHDRTLYSCRLQTDAPNSGGAQPGFGVKTASLPGVSFRSGFSSLALKPRSI